MKYTIIISIILITSNLIASSGKHIYKKECLICHGKYGEKKALGISQPINKLSQKEIDIAISKYSSGKQKTSKMVKDIKIKFIKKYDKKERESVYNYIGK